MASQRQVETRRAILDALAAEIVGSSATGFSIQQVADRAGVTHRTVYNHFPTRQALNDAFAVHVEEELAAVVEGDRPPEESVAASAVDSVLTDAYASFEKRSLYVHAYVMLMIASGAPARLTRERTDRIARGLEHELEPLTAETARLSAAALRMFVSTTAWHLLTRHLGLTTEEASRTATWATRTLLRALQSGDHPGLEDAHEAGNDSR
jgi:AcrR family transcriptional regulator